MRSCKHGSSMGKSLGPFTNLPSVITSYIKIIQYKKCNTGIILGRPKRSFGFFCKVVWKNLNELLGQPNTITRPQILLGFKQLNFFFLILIEW